MPANPNKLSQFWQELKRRKVVRVITVYAAAAFVILELVDIIAPNLGLPAWTFNLVLILICVGFIITVIVSWVFDVTPEGIEKTKPAHKVKEKDEPVSSKSWKIASYISFVVIVALIVLNIIPRTSRTDIKEVLNKSIAVLPLEYLSANPDNEYLANGVLDAITGHLSLIKGLRVMPRTSVEQYRENKKTAKEIGEELDVSYLVEGSFQMVDNQVKLIIQLVLAEEGDHIFFKEYDRNYSDIFTVQSEVAQTIAKEIEVVITPEEKQRIEKIPTTNLTAYDFYQRGREEYHKFGRPFDNRKALERAEDYFYKALVYDSTFALAYAGLAWIYKHKNYWETLLTENFIDSTLILANIALSFDDQLSEAYVARGDYYRANNNKEQAIDEYDKAIKYNPNDWQAYMSKGSLYIQDNLVKSIDNLNKAASLHRGSVLPRIYRGLFFAYMNAGFKERAYYYATEAFKLDEDSAAYYDNLAFSEEAIGNYEKAIEYDEKAYAIDSTDHWVIHHLGSYHSYLGQFEESLRYFKEYDRRFKALNQPHPHGIFRIGHAYWVNGFKDQAEYYFNTGLKFYNELNELDRTNLGSYYYNLASIYAFLGDKEKAFENLRLYNRGQVTLFFMIATIKNDPLFDNIRNEPEFQQIVRGMEAKYQAEHDRVRQWLEENDML